MKSNLKTVSVAIPKKQFDQMMEYMAKRRNTEGFELTTASFLRLVINDYLTSKGYEEVEMTLQPRKGRPSKKN